MKGDSIMKKLIIKRGFRTDLVCGSYTTYLLYTDEEYCGKGKEVSLSALKRSLGDDGLDYINENPGGKLYLIEDPKEIESLTKEES